MCPHFTCSCAITVCADIETLNLAPTESEALNLYVKKLFSPCMASL